jgi:hypothetical protein
LAALKQPAWSFTYALEVGRGETEKTGTEVFVAGKLALLCQNGVKLRLMLPVIVTYSKVTCRDWGWVWGPSPCLCIKDLDFSPPEPILWYVGSLQGQRARWGHDPEAAGGHYLSVLAQDGYIGYIGDFPRNCKDAPSQDREHRRPHFFWGGVWASSLSAIGSRGQRDALEPGWNDGAQEGAEGVRV